VLLALEPAVGKVGEQGVELRAGARVQRALDPLVELLGRQAPVRRVVAQQRDDVVALAVGDAKGGITLDPPLNVMTVLVVPMPAHGLSSENLCSSLDYRIKR
jgi:hypothetical protein